MVQSLPVANKKAWDDFKVQCSAPHEDTGFTILTSLRQSYPDHIVTVAPESAALHKFAEAKHAQVALDEDEERFLLWRSYIPAERRSSVDDGKLHDDVKFGKFGSSWKGHDFIVYYADIIVDYMFNQHQKLYFILYERSKAAGESRPKVVDDLIAASTKWDQVSNPSSLNYLVLYAFI